MELVVGMEMTEKLVSPFFREAIENKVKTFSPEAIGNLVKTFSPEVISYLPVCLGIGRKVTLDCGTRLEIVWRDS